MAKKAELLEAPGNAAANSGFLLAYQKAVLFALYKDGILDQEQLERCNLALDRTMKESIQ